MRKWSSFIIVFLFFINSEEVYSQKKAQIELLKSYCKKILRDTTKKEIKIEESELGERRGFLLAYTLYDSLIQITWINAHVSIYQTDYLLKDGLFISSRVSKRTPGFTDSGTKNKKFNYEETYYYVNNKLYKIDNYKNKIKRAKKHVKKYLLENIEEYKQIIFRHNK